MGVAEPDGVRQSHFGEATDDAGFDLGDAVDQERFGEGTVHSLAGVERPVWVLEDHLDATEEFLRAFGAEQLAIKQDAAGPGWG